MSEVPLEIHEGYMLQAIELAKQASALNEVPVGCVIVKDNNIIGKGFNTILTRKNPLLHAEINAITASSSFLNYERLLDCTLYVTLEPCPMCAGAIVNARIPTIVYGCKDPKAGACGSILNIVNDARLNHRVKTINGVLEEECSQLLRAFFRYIRQNKNRKLK